MSDHILVTGGAGYIGSHVCKALAKAGFIPIVYDNLSTGHAYAVKWGPFVEGDLADSAKLKETIESFKPKAVLHFAAKALVVESVLDPALYYANNLAGTLSLLNAMKECSLFNLIFSSSCAIYGTPQFNPITEENPQSPINAYGRTKWFSEQIMADWEAAYGLKTITLRYFNAAGADLETQIGEDHFPETHLIPSIIQTALGLKEEVVVFGTDFPTRDGSAVRDYVHVQDLADAHVLCLKYLLTNQKSAAFNLGTGKGASVLEIIDAVKTFCAKSFPIRLENKRLGEPAMLTADCRKIKEMLGWAPRFSDIRVLIESAWKWHQLLIETTPILRSTMQRLENLSPERHSNANRYSSSI